ncbi:MAG: hypothetical protein ACUVQV_00450 [Dissulfurimicrobium sp.]|uniref:hypothetical protein n=1 Tax=Dissulfurimicrobium sp. TaxID=2022436 RepID=UPI0040499245
MKFCGMVIFSAMLLICASGFTQGAFAGEKLGIIVYSDDSEAVWNALRLANFSIKKGDAVCIFFWAKAWLAHKGQIDSFVQAGGKVYACNICLKLHKLEPSKTCPFSTMNDLYIMSSGQTARCLLSESIKDQHV